MLSDVLFSSIEAVVEVKANGDVLAPNKLFVVAAGFPFAPLMAVPKKFGGGASLGIRPKLGMRDESASFVRLGAGGSAGLVKNGDGLEDKRGSAGFENSDVEFDA